MRAWLATLAPRERAMLMIGAACVAAFVYYAAVWAPLAAGIRQRHHRIDRLQSLVTWLDDAAQRANALRASRTGSAPTGQNRSLLSIIDQSSKDGGLGQAVTRIQPGGTDHTRVWLKGAPFNTVVRWLNTLQSQFGVSVTSASISASPQSGRVNARLNLTRGEAS